MCLLLRCFGLALMFKACLIDDALGSHGHDAAFGRVAAALITIWPG